jgi:hypothetical protein
MAMVVSLFRTMEVQLHVQGGERGRGLLCAALIVAVSLGSTNVFLCSESKVYQEAAIWGSALALAQAVFLVRYLAERKAAWLALTCATAFLALFARVSSGAGALVSLGIVGAAALAPFRRLKEFWGVALLPSVRRVALAVGGSILLTGALQLGLNYWKWGNIFIARPLRLNEQFRSNPERLARINGNGFLPAKANVNALSWAFFSPTDIRFRPGFPWVFRTPVAELRNRFPDAPLDYIEPCASLPATAPALFFAGLAGIGLCFVGRRPELCACRAPLLGALAGGVTVTTLGAICYRYLHDSFPWMVVAAAIAVAHIPRLKRPWLRNCLTGLLLAATAYSAWANFAIAIEQQRVLSYPIPQEKIFSYDDFRHAVDSSGAGGAVKFLTHWRHYVEAASFEAGNLGVDRGAAAGRDDLPVIMSRGQTPGIADYTVAVPRDDDYEVSIRCASADARPLELILNGRLVWPPACRQPTGGWDQAHQRWAVIASLPFHRGANSLRLRRDGYFPVVSMIRIVE